MNHESLIFIPKPKHSASIRLICFSYAGGSAATYIPWQNLLHSEIELAIVQLPGRGARLKEPPYQTMNELVKDLFIEIEKLDHKPFIFYGHSMGARVCYELTLMLYKFSRRLPIHVIASGSEAPCTDRSKPQTYHLPNDEFIKKLNELNGSPKEVLDNHEIMQLLLPALRADFKIIETYCNKNQLIIPTKISIFAGNNDKVKHEDLEGWLKLFQSNNGITWITGDHFFIEKNRTDVLKTLHHIIIEHLN